MPLAAVGGLDVVVDDGERLLRRAHLAAGHAQPLERLRARHLVHEMAVDIDQAIAALGLDDVVVPDLVVQRARLGHVLLRRPFRRLRLRKRRYLSPTGPEGKRAASPGASMATLVEDLRQVIERDQWAARPLLHDLVERLPHSVEARALLAQSYLRSLEAGAALEHYGIAQRLEPKNLFLRCQMGLCATAIGDYEAALTIYRDANTVQPNEHAQTMAALLLHRLGRVGEAIKTYSDLLGRMKRDNIELPCTLRGLAMALRDAGLPLASDRILSELVSLYRLDPPRIAAIVCERDNSIDHPGWTQFASKSELALALRRARQQPWAPRHPESFLMPEDREALLSHAEENPGALFISKPRRGTGGQNMTISRDAARSPTSPTSWCSVMSSAPISSTAARVMCGCMGWSPRSIRSAPICTPRGSCASRRSPIM